MKEAVKGILVAGWIAHSGHTMLRPVEMNPKMAPLYQSAIGEGEQHVQDATPRLEDLVDFDLEELGDAILLKSQEERAGVNVSDFENLTEYECWVNRLRVQDYKDVDEIEAMREAYAFVTALNEKLATFAPKSKFRYIITSGERGCMVRFHLVRAGERWSENSSEEEARLVLESDDLAGPGPELVTVATFRDLPEALLARPKSNLRGYSAGWLTTT